MFERWARQILHLSVIDELGGWQGWHAARSEMRRLMTRVRLASRQRASWQPAPQPRSWLGRSALGRRVFGGATVRPNPIYLCYFMVLGFRVTPHAGLSSYWESWQLRWYLGCTLMAAFHGVIMAVWFAQLGCYRCSLHTSCVSLSCTPRHPSRLLVIYCSGFAKPGLIRLYKP